MVQRSAHHVATKTSLVHNKSPRFLPLSPTSQEWSAPRVWEPVSDLTRGTPDRSLRAGRCHCFIELSGEVTGVVIRKEANGVIYRACTMAPAPT